MTHQMEYRRLGRTGLKVSVLSFGSWVTFDAQLKDDLGARVHAGRPRRRVQLLRQRRGLRRWRERGDHGSRAGRARLAALVLRADHQGLLGHPQRPEHAQHAEPQVPDAGDRRLTRAVRRRLRRPPLLPPFRSGHHARGDGVGDERHRVVGEGDVLGYQRVGGRRDPRRHRDRRAPPPPQAGHRAAAVQPVRTGAGRAGVRPDLRRHWVRRHDLEPAGLRSADRQVPRRHPRRLAWLPARLRLAGPAAVGRAGARQGRGAAPDRRRARLHARPARAGVVHDEPQRLDGHHGSQPAEPGRRELRRRRGDLEARRRRRWRASTTPSGRRASRSTSGSSRGG